MLHSTTAKGKGHFKIQVFGPNGDEKQFGNLLLDRWLTMMNTAGTAKYSNLACVVGSGTSPVVATDTTMESPIAVKYQASSTYNNTGYIDGTNVIYEYVGVFEFPLGSVVGNISKVGLANQGSTSLTQPLLAMALVKDVNGNPTTISVGASDLLVITHTTRVTVPMIDSVSSIEFRPGEITTVTGRFGSGYARTFNEFCNGPYFSTSWSYMRYGASVVFGGHGVDPTGGTGNYAGSSFTTTYTTLPNGDGIQLKITVPISEWNFSDIRTYSLPIGYGIGFKWEFSPGITKTSSEILELYFVRKFERDES